MKIECTIKRDREVTLGDTTYHFVKDDQGRYVAEVNDEEHIDLLLGIRCYRKLVDAGSKSAVKATDGDITAPTVVTAPTAAATQTPTAVASGNPLAGQGLGNTIQPDDDGEEGSGEGDKGVDTAPEALDRDKLAAEYEARFNKKPHHSQSAERIKQLLEQDND